MSFDTLAPYYRRMEWLLAGDKLQKCRTAFLGETISCRQLLLLGEGPGKFLEELLLANPTAQVTCVDASPVMLQLAKRALEKKKLSLERVTFECADVLKKEFPRGNFDCIATHFFLDCFRPEQLSFLTARLAAALRPGGLWLQTDFAEPPHGLARRRARWILASMYLFFRVATRLPARQLSSPDPYLKENGFELLRRKSAEFGLLQSDLWRKAE